MIGLFIVFLCKCASSSQFSAQDTPLPLSTTRELSSEFLLPCLCLFPIALNPFIHLAATLLSSHICTVVPSLLTEMVLSHGPTARGHFLSLSALTEFSNFWCVRLSAPGQKSRHLSCPFCSCTASLFDPAQPIHTQTCPRHIHDRAITIGASMLSVCLGPSSQAKTCCMVSSTTFDCFSQTHPRVLHMHSAMTSDSISLPFSRSARPMFCLPFFLTGPHLLIIRVHHPCIPTASLCFCKFGHLSTKPCGLSANVLPNFRAICWSGQRCIAENWNCFEGKLVPSILVFPSSCPP